MPRIHIPNGIIVFIVSFSLIVYEIFLSRYFSVLLDYSYVFVVISLATLGIGLGAYGAYRSMNRIRLWKIPALGVLAVMLILSVFLIYVLPYSGVVVYAVLALLPYVAGGYLLAGIMQTGRQHVHLLYLSDLFGAGVGAAGAVMLMNIVQPVQTIGLLSFGLFIVYFAWCYPGLKPVMKAAHYIVFIVLLYNVINPFVTYLDFTAYQTSPYKAMYRQEDAEIVYSDWNAFSRTDVYDAGDELLYMTIDGSAVSPISKFTGDWDQVRYLMSTTGSLAFMNTAKDKALIIGSGGGQEVLTAKMAGFQEIEAVDINRGSFDAVQKLAGITGNLYNQQGVKPIVSDGRSYIRKTESQYDLIYLSLVFKPSESGLGLMLTENYIYTREALKDYLEKITTTGQLAFLLHDGAELAKILYAAENVLMGMGVAPEDIGQYISVIGTYQHLGHIVDGKGGNAITRPLLMIKKQPFDRSEASALLESAKNIQQNPVHIPFVLDSYKPLHEILNTHKVDLAANRDDQPYFYRKTASIPVPLIVTLMGTLIMAGWIARQKAISTGQGIYFAGIAIGFMLIEVTLIQKFILPLGHPTLSFVLVLGSLLVSGGVGSYFSIKWRPGPNQRFAPLLMVCIMTIGVAILTDLFQPLIFAQPLPIKLLIAVCLLVPLGFYMGMPFPFGLSRADNRQTAILWGLNGMMTVAGSVMASMISLSFGFTVTLETGALVYLFLFIVQPLLRV